MRGEMKSYENILSDIFSKINNNNTKFNWKHILLITLLVFSIVYYFYGFQLSFIPYSTAWDANHAYMY